MTKKPSHNGKEMIQATGTFEKTDLIQKRSLKKIDDVWYYFDNSGYMLAERWKKHSDGNWYWFDKSGAMATGWKKIAESWYYFDVEGAMKTGWVKYKETWYCLDSKDGNMVSNAFIQSADKKRLVLPQTRRQLGRQARIHSRARRPNYN